MPTPRSPLLFLALWAWPLSACSQGGASQEVAPRDPGESEVVTPPPGPADSEASALPSTPTATPGATSRAGETSPPPAAGDVEKGGEVEEAQVSWERQAGDPPDWTPVREIEGEPVVTLREYFPGGKLRRIACFEEGHLGEPDHRHGPEWTFFQNGFKKETLEYRHGVPEGPFSRAWQNGQMRYQGTFVNGKRHGTYRQWWPTGDLQMEFEYDHGKPVGTWREYYVGEQPKLVEHYVDGLLEGERRTWDKPREDENGNHLDGLLTTVEHYVGGKLDGPWQDYDITTGTPRLSGNYSDGLREGRWILQWRNGQVIEESHYLHGELHGLHRKYTSEGILIEEDTWEHGEKTGIARQFYADGTVQVEGSYRNGLREGPWRYYTKAGELNRNWSGIFEDDIRVGELPDGE